MPRRGGALTVSWLYRYQLSGERYESWLHVRLRRQGKPHPSPRRDYPHIKPCHKVTDAS